MTGEKSCDVFAPNGKPIELSQLAAYSGRTEFGRPAVYLYRMIDEANGCNVEHVACRSRSELEAFYGSDENAEYSSEAEQFLDICGRECFVSVLEVIVCS
jgi:hypothetical protein